MQQKPGTSVVKTACSYCGVGCGIVLDVETDPETGRRKVLKASGDKEHPTNFGRICTKGATSAEMLAADGRMESGYLRAERGAAPTPVGVDEAIRERLFPNSVLKGSANLFVMPNLDAANIAYNLVRVMTDGVALGPILMGVDHPAHVMTAGATPRRVVNMTAITAVEAQIRAARRGGTQAQGEADAG